MRLQRRQQIPRSHQSCRQSRSHQSHHSLRAPEGYRILEVETLPV